jgi:HK97 family phage major capsid protein
MTTPPDAAQAAGRPARDENIKRAQTRQVTFELSERAADSETIPVVISTDAVVEVQDGPEILVHSREAIDLQRAPLPIIATHRGNQVNVGIVENVRPAEGKLRGDARFGERQEAREYRTDVLNGVIRSVSAGYHRIKASIRSDGVMVTSRWMPTHVAMVAEPADVGAGFFRAATETTTTTTTTITGSTGPEFFFPPTTAQTADRSIAMTDQVNATAAAAEPSVEIVREQPNLVEFEAKRKAAIRSLCIANKLDERYERSWIESGADMGQVADDIIQILAERGKTNPQSVTLLGMGKTDVRRYSLLRALRAAINNDWKDAGLELECNNELSKRLDKSPRSAKSFFVPLDVLMRDIPGSQKRDMTVAGVSGSNYLVSTDNMPGNFIDLLRNTSVGLRMGVQRLSGLKGNVTIPKMTAGNTAYWLSDETTQITESQPTIGQLSLAPKNVAALTELSHQLMVQSSPDVENLVLQSIARDIGLAVDVGILRGSGASGQPTGIATTGSIGAFTGTSLAAAGLLDAQADVAAANALNPGCGYVTTPAVAALLMARPELPTTGTTRMWKGNMAEGSIFDFPAMSSAQMSSATMLFGWWPSVLLAEWGVLELMVNPFSDFTRGLTAVRGWYTCDVGVRYAGAWSYATSIT